MNNDNDKIKAKMNEVGQKIGLNEKDLDSILDNTFSINEQFSLADGPVPYLGSLYATVSTKDFQ